MEKNRNLSIGILLFAAHFFIGLNAYSQQWIKKMPGYEQYEKVAPQIRNSVKSGIIKVHWAEDGKSFDYNFDGIKYRFEIKKKKAEKIGGGEQEESFMT